MSGSRKPKSLSRRSSSAAGCRVAVRWTKRCGAELTELLRAGRKIEAIKRYREQTGVGLKVAKDAVEGLATASGLTASRGSGCLSALLLAGILIAGLFLA